MNKKIIIIVAIVIVVIAGIIAFGVVSNGKKEESNVKDQSSSVYEVEYKGVNITPGQKFDETAISEEYSLSEIQSCAFEGNDKVYTYSGVEIIVAEVEGVDTVYSVYFLDPEMQTKEGVKISDSKDKIISTYGDNYESTVENSYAYTKDDVTLSFIVQNDTIISIEYTLNIND